MNPYIDRVRMRCIGECDSHSSSRTAARELLGEAKQLTGNPFFVVIYDTQSVDDVVKILTGVNVSSYEMKKEGIARFRLSNYLPAGEELVNSLKEIISTHDWIVLHAACSICPEIVLEFFQFLSEQSFSKPRIVVIGEQTDVTYGDERMKKLFRSGPLVNLVYGEI